ncbi:MAG: hypothetical protein GWP10_10225 [Nitrospiraceae bacterium]|nr:hypothetical protein [Nitrospiraceae bacterium]
MQQARLERELVIRTEQRLDLVAEVAHILAEMGVNIFAVNLCVDGDQAVVRLITSAQTYARDALQRACLPVTEREVVVIELPERAGFLEKVTAALARQKIQLNDLYATASEGTRMTTVVFSCSHNAKAALMFQKK